MTYFQALLLTRIDYLPVYLASIIGVLIGYIIYRAIAKKSIKWFAPLLIVLFTVKGLLPTKEELAFILIAPPIVNNKSIQSSVTLIPDLIALSGELKKKKLSKSIQDIDNEIKENKSSNNKSKDSSSPKVKVDPNKPEVDIIPIIPSKYPISDNSKITLPTKKLLTSVDSLGGLDDTVKESLKNIVKDSIGISNSDHMVIMDSMLANLLSSKSKTN